MIENYENIQKAINDKQYVKVIHTLSFTSEKLKRLDQLADEYINTIQGNTYFSLLGSLFEINNKVYATEETKLLIDSWFEFCYKKWISPFEFLTSYFRQLFNKGIYNQEFLFQLDQYAKENSLKSYQPTKEDAEAYVSTLGRYSIKIITDLTRTQDKLSNEFKRESLEKLITNTTDNVKENIKNRYQLEKNIIPEVVLRKATGEEILDSIYKIEEIPKAIKRTLYKPKNHKDVLTKIFNSPIEVTPNFRPLLVDLSEGIEVGFITRTLLDGVVDKDYVIKKLNELINLNKELGTKSTDIHRLQALIELLQEKKHREHIPYKSIAKKLGMTQNEAFNFEKIVLGSSNALSKQTYDRNFKNWKDIDSLKKN